MRAARSILVGVLLVAASCGSPTATSPAPPTAAPPPGSTTPAPAGPTATGPGAPVVSAAPPTPAAAITGGRWEAAGSLALGRRATRALALGDGRVLVVGNDTDSCVRADSRRTELYDPTTGAWSAGPRLNKGRAAFAGVALANGRALVTGGINPDLASYSSSYEFNPADPAAGWMRSGLLKTARTSPACAAVAEGRILVAGGFFQVGAPDVETPPGEMGVIPETEALATAELYDPATGEWSRTGRLRQARTGAAAVGLADGRALIVGSNDAFMFGSYVSGTGEAAFTAETFDPAGGRFTLTGALPALDMTPVLALEGATDPEADEPGSNVGTLVALADGDALLIGREMSWYAGRGWSGVIVRSFRFNAVDETWRTIDEQIVGCNGLALQSADCDEVRPWQVILPGHSRMDASAVLLVDGKVLVAGGVDPATGTPSAAAELFDPGSGEWTVLPPLPEPRAGAAAAVLGDGSVVLVGGYADDACLDDCRCNATGLASAVRFVPSN